MGSGGGKVNKNNGSALFWGKILGSAAAKSTKQRLGAVLGEILGSAVAKSTKQRLGAVLGEILGSGGGGGMTVGRQSRQSNVMNKIKAKNESKMKQRRQIGNGKNP